VAEERTQAKRMAGERAAELVENGMRIGLGSGSTVYWTIRRLGQRVRSGLRIEAIPSSRATEQWARAVNIPLTSFAQVKELDLTLDGADEIAPDLSLIKGGGGALLREKLVAAASRRLVIVADDSKPVSVLGKFPLAVEVVPFGWEVTRERIARLGADPVLRREGQDPFITDSRHYILDCAFGAIPDPGRLHAELKALVGVVETGLFVGMAEAAIVSDGRTVKMLRRPPKTGTSPT
jgi:ribose 5-phosphate isomerase A